MKIPSTPEFTAAQSILTTLRHSGYEAYLAGGCVRDLLLGREPADYDVATSATPDIVLNLFPRTYGVGAHFGVVLVHNQIEAQPTLTEVATFRSDGEYSDGRHPNQVRYTLSAQDDVQRRDFTINGLLLDPKAFDHSAIKGKAQTPVCAGVIDHVAGLMDLESGTIRAIGDPTQRFQEDHLRMLRAVRFAARFNFQIAPETQAALRALAPKIQSVSRERLRGELTRMLTEGRARHAFELLDATGLLPHILPEIQKLKGVPQPPEWHPEGDVWTHTLLLLEQLEPGCSLTLAWGALLHDIGKPATYQPPSHPGDRIRFNGHVEIGVRIGAEICRRLRFSNDETTQILALIHNHMRFGDAPRMKDSTLKSFFRLHDFPEHLALHRMDSLASSGNLDLYHYAKERYNTTPATELRPPALVSGRELIALGYHPGPLFKTILHAIEEAQLNSAIATPEEALSLVQQNFPLKQ